MPRGWIAECEAARILDCRIDHVHDCYLTFSGSKRPWRSTEDGGREYSLRYVLELAKARDRDPTLCVCDDDPPIDRDGVCVDCHRWAWVEGP